MKYKVDWTSPTQGIRSTTVDALNMTAAREQVESMYAHIKGFNAFCVSPVFDREEQPEQQQSSSRSYSNSGGGGIDELSTLIATAGFFVGGGAFLLGLFTLPSGIVAMVIGGAVGWVGWKVACWLSDRGW